MHAASSGVSSNSSHSSSTGTSGSGTVIHTRQNKIMLDVALGFDSYVVMRHGCSVQDAGLAGGSGSIAGLAGTGTATAIGSTSRLGCYFCNDIIGVQNTLKDRTLDQQCTVTRPGLAYIASALAVEMMIAMLHCDPSTLGSEGKNASFGGSASGSNQNQSESQSTTEPKPGAGAGTQSVVYSKQESDIPHQIRGSLLGFTQIDAAVSLVLHVLYSVPNSVYIRLFHRQ